ncbi:MAG: rod shape-determining protein MreC, partial [Microcystaceae cyanobacterium]
MLTVRRWWTRHALQIILAGVVLGGAWFLKQTQGAAVLEIYSLIVRPFQSESPSAQEAKLTNARIQELEQQVTELQQQNQHLQELLGYFKNQKQQVITAPIVGRSADAWWKQITLGRGSQDGIEVGAVVTGVGGLVGRVVEVTPHSSRVLLISDPTSRVGATITRSRSMGLIQGQGSQ